jgi:hypothetical protein
MRDGLSLSKAPKSVLELVVDSVGVVRAHGHTL